MTRPAESRVGGNERFGNEPPRWIAVLDRIRLIGLLRKKPWKQGFFYAYPRPNVGAHTCMYLKDGIYLV